MLRKKLGLSTEPQPVFVGACFALLMLLMQFDFIFISAEKHKLIQYFNVPTMLTVFMIRSAAVDIALMTTWITNVIVPIVMFVICIFWGKKHARLLMIPAVLSAIGSAVSLIFGSFTFSYNVMSAIYIATAVFYLLTPILKTSLPFFVYCMVLSVLTLILTVIGKGAFVSSDGDVYISLMVYFVGYHIAVGNFARAIPIQTKERATLKAKK
jgi:hypothetical protein